MLDPLRQDRCGLGEFPGQRLRLLPSQDVGNRLFAPSRAQRRYGGLVTGQEFQREGGFEWATPRQSIQVT
ncbi:hypothetical protein ACH4FX_31275 [Streptomyces sp. NPDC018019]|uniref:hypothetical protein n=1 Tax=Streptomyces sp. NPDC018019 TaxID=3365030 RepID=UPI0037A3131D